MLNEKVFDLVLEILKSRLSPQTQEEIVRFFVLPRNTTIRPLIELPDEEVLSELGSVKRPDIEELDKRANPQREQEKQAVKETLDGLNKKIEN